MNGEEEARETAEDVSRVSKQAVVSGKSLDILGTKYVYMAATDSSKLRQKPRSQTESLSFATEIGGRHLASSPGHHRHGVP